MRCLLLILSVIVISEFLSSCKNSEIIKRKYNKGYYISHSGKKQTNPSSRETETIDNAVTATAPESKPETATDEPKATENTESKTALASSENESKAFSSSDMIKKLHKRTEAIGSTIPLGITPRTTQAEDLKNTSVLSQTSDPARDALSLLWIVIVIILIVYVIGLLLDGFGLGLAIHVLAVIALVLLILWLLRIL